ncbi:MAG: hypothetical protein AAF447_08465 [Myxococcota bacterium]
MANEIRAHLSASYAGLAITARLVAPDGSQQGSVLPMVESATIPALFLASVPAATPEGRYDVRVEDAAGVIGVDMLEWTGTEEARVSDRVRDLWVEQGHDGNTVAVVDPTGEGAANAGSLTAGAGAQVHEITQTATGHTRRRTT